MTNSPPKPHWLSSQVLRFFTAVRFLTVIPVSWRAEGDAENFKSCINYFPVVGLLIGLFGAGFCKLLLLFFPVPVVAIAIIAYLCFISNCLHLDGLSDSGDGLFSSRPKNRSLEIMKDSRVGAMGVIIVTLVLVAKYAALSSLGPGTLPLAVLFMPLAGRSSIILTMATVKYAREEGGLGEMFYSSKSRVAAIFASLIFGGTLLAYDIQKGVFCLIFVLLGTLLFNRFCCTRLGGATGDTLGANCEIAEMMVAVSFTASFF